VVGVVKIGAGNLEGHRWGFDEIVDVQLES
jgi:hypothetical protein